MTRTLVGTPDPEPDPRINSLSGRVQLVIDGARFLGSTNVAAASVTELRIAVGRAAAAPLLWEGDQA